MIHYTDPVPPTPLPLDGTSYLDLNDGPLTAHRSVLPQGVRVLTETVPGTRSASIGLWFPVGSRDENDAQGGAAHFLEHLLFKGTTTRSALDIAKAFDEVGGETNAATGKESTHYWARVLDDDAPMAIATLMDMVSSSVLADNDVETERGVILDELAMAEDSPADVVQDDFIRAVFGDSPIGRPIGGTPESVRATSPAEIRRLYHDRYFPESLTVAAAGNISHEQVCEIVTKTLENSAWGGSTIPRELDRRRNNGSLAMGKPEEVIDERDIEQAHIMVGGRWLDASDKLRPVSTVFTTLLGGGTSSRLFQEIREKRGLAYTTYAFDMAMTDTGLFGMYAGCAPDNIDEVQKIMWAEVERLAAGDLSNDELERVKGQLRGGIALGMEDSASRMSRLGRSELTGRFTSIDGVLARINAVAVEDVQELAAKALAVPPARAIVRPNV